MVIRNDKWTLENIKSGINRFFIENKKYPTARDFDKTDYLPPARTIQRNFGGLERIRGLLIPDSPKNFTVGETRSRVSKDSKIRSYEHEGVFYNFLLSKVPEVRVHEQKRLRPGNIASDFFVYINDNSGFAIDIFHSSDRFNTIGILNIKIKRYRNLSMSIVFIVMGNFTQDELDLLLKNKKNKLPGNISLYTNKYFKDNFDSIVKSLSLDMA